MLKYEYPILSTPGLVINEKLVSAGSIVGSQLMKTKLSGTQLKKIIGVLLWGIALKMILDLIK